MAPTEVETKDMDLCRGNRDTCNIRVRLIVNARCAETIIFRPSKSTLLTDFTQSGTLAEAVTIFQLDLSLISGTDTRPELLTVTLAAIAYRVRLNSLTIAKNISSSS